MSIDPNRELNPVFSDDADDAFGGPGEGAAPGTDLGSPDMRGVVRREPPGVPPAGSVDRVVDDPGVSLPNAGRADRGADLESRTSQSVVPEERRDSDPDAVDSSADTASGGHLDDETTR